MDATTATVVEHAWREQTFREPTYQIAFGVERTCQVCNRKQFTDYTSGSAGEVKFDQRIDTSTGCKTPEST